jgi:hypothetical protein
MNHVVKPGALHSIDPLSVGDKPATEEKKPIITETLPEPERVEEKRLDEVPAHKPNPLFVE